MQQLETGSVDLSPTTSLAISATFSAGLSYLDLADLTSEENLLEELITGRRLGVVVRGFLTASEAASLVQGVSSQAETGPCTPVPHASGAVYGGLLAMAHAIGMEGYLAQAAGTRAMRVGEVSLDTLLRDRLALVAGGHRPSTPVSTDGRAYAPFSVRRMDAGGTLLLHCENETADMPMLAEVAAQIDPPFQLSFYVLLARPTAGAELFIYPFCHGEPGAQAVTDGGREVDSVLARTKGVPIVSPEMEAGDLILFDAGRYYHLLTRCVGPQPRWTMGALLARTRNKDGWLMWS